MIKVNINQTEFDLFDLMKCRQKQRDGNSNNAATVATNHHCSALDHLQVGAGGEKNEENLVSK